MIDNELDNETVAAFLDGTLPEEERARVMRLMAASPELYRTALEAAKVSAALHGDATALQVAARPNRWQRRIMIAAPFLAAAGIAGVLLMRRDNPPDALTIARANVPGERGAGSIDRALGSTWDQPGWAVVRGDPGSPSVGTTVRIGARVAQLEFAASASDSVAWRRVAASLGEMLASIDGAGPVSEQLRGDGIPNDATRSTAFSRLRQLSSSPAAFDLGVWLESARLAGRGQNASFVMSTAASLRSIVDALGRDAAAAGQLRQVTGAIQPLLQTGAPADLPRLTALVDTAMAAIPR